MRFDRCFAPLIVFGLVASATPADASENPETDDKLPKAVRKAIKANYPGAKIVGSSKEKDEEGETIFEVELMVKGKSVDLLIDEEGEIEETEKEIALSDLPTAVTNALFKAFPKFKIEKAEEVTLEGDKVVYEVLVVGKGKKSTEVVVVPNGKILKSAKVEEEDDDKPKAKKKEMEEDDEDEDDDKPKAKKKEMEEDDEDEDDDKPKAKKKEMEEDDEDEDDDKPKAKKKEMEEDDEDEDDDKDKEKKEKGEKKPKD